MPTIVIAYNINSKLCRFKKCDVHTEIDRRARHGKSPTMSVLERCKSVNSNQNNAGNTKHITWICWHLNQGIKRKIYNIPNPSGAPGMVARSCVNANTVPIGTTTISFRCRKPKKTVAIMIKQIMTVIIPINIPMRLIHVCKCIMKRQTKCDGDD